jgi:23S rRNA G2069 N7-methylase RlmK/C1962 C5-methylase RlmI
VFRAAGAAADHPVAAAMPETRYLTCLIAFIDAL